MRLDSFIPATSERRVFEPMFRAALHGTRQGLVGGVMLVLLLSWLFREDLGGQAFPWWLGAFVTVAVGRAVMLAAWARQDDAALGRAHAVATVLLFAVAGTLWGLAGFAFPVHGTHWAPYVVLCSQFILVVMAVPGLSWYWPCFVAFALPVQLLAPWPWFGIDAEVAWVVAIGGVFNLATLAGFAARHAGIQLATLRLRDERQAMLQALEGKTAALAYSVASKSRFLAAASHDLRQPLQAMALLINGARRGGPQALGPQGLQVLDQMVTAADEMLESLVEAARADDPAGAWERQPCDVQALIDQVADEQAGAAADRGLLLRVRRGAHGAMSHPVALRRILRNLLCNAIRYTERGGVLVALRRRGGQLWMEVWDTGRGIAEADRERVFEPYERLPPPGDPATAAAPRGIGLGLAVVRQLCQALGHPVELVSRPGRGSVFRVGLGPALELPAAPEPAQQALRPAVAPVGLFVRDNLLALELCALLRQWDLRWQLFPDAAQWEAEAARWAGVVPVVEAGTSPEGVPARLLVSFRRRGLRSVWLGGAAGRTAPPLGLPGERVDLPLPLEPVRLRAALSRLLALERFVAGAPAQSPGTANSP